MTSAGNLDSTSSGCLDSTSAAAGAAKKDPNHKAADYSGASVYVRSRGRPPQGRNSKKRLRPSESEEVAEASRIGGEPPKFPHFEFHSYFMFSSGPSTIEHRLTGPRRVHVPIGSSRRRQ